MGLSPGFEVWRTNADDPTAHPQAAEAAAIQFVMDAFGHLKAIGHTPEAQPLLDKAGVEPDEGVVDLDNFTKAAGKRYWEREPAVRMLA